MKCEKCSDRTCDFVEDCPVVKTAPVSNSRLIDGLCWQGVDAVKEEGWYWVDDYQGKHIIYIRQYGGKWCLTNWEIAKDAKYAGPIKEPI